MTRSLPGFDQGLFNCPSQGASIDQQNVQLYHGGLMDDRNSRIAIFVDVGRATRNGEPNQSELLSTYWTHNKANTTELGLNWAEIS